MPKYRFLSVVILLLAGFLTFFIISSEQGTRFEGKAFKLGLDLSGGTHLVYKANIDELSEGDVSDAMDSLRDAIERRVNLFGVSEPVVQLERGEDERLIVELPGVTDVSQAIKLIGATPLLEFRTEKTGTDPVLLSQALQVHSEESFQGIVTEETRTKLDSFFESTDLTGRYLKKAQLIFDPNTREPTVSLMFDGEGRDLFAEITRNSTGRIVAIYLDGAPISLPVVREEIVTGEAIISGDFTPEEARELVGRLNSGALPVPIELISTQKIGASLGDKAVADGARAGLVGIALVALFLILWYRLPGVLAVLALLVYVAVMLALFKLIPVTLTAAGIAGFILSIGMAVDANILIFERMKEELRKGKDIEDAMHEGFSRAWPSIRDSNISSMITAVILFWMGTSLIQGFALTFGMGVIVSMFTAITITRTFLYALGTHQGGKFTLFLFGSGLTK